MLHLWKSELDNLVFSQIYSPVRLTEDQGNPGSAHTDVYATNQSCKLKPGPPVVFGKYDLILGQSSETSLSGGWFVQWLDVGLVNREMELESQLPSLST